MKTYMITAHVEVQAYDSVDALMRFGKNLSQIDAELIDVDITEVS